MKKEKPVYVLGTGLSHDGSACLLKDGKITVAIEKERITRMKHDGYNDDAAIQYCLQAEDISIEEVDLIVQSGNYSLFLDNQLAAQEWKYGSRIVKSPHHNVPVVTLSHHLAHAYNAIGTAPFEDMAVLVIDGSGHAVRNCMDLEGINIQIPADVNHLYLETDSFYLYRDSKLTTLRKEFSCFSEFQFNEGVLPMLPDKLKHSLGNMYEQASAYCFGKGGFHAGKLMGLAPYGRPGVYRYEIFECKDGRVSVKYDWQQYFDKAVQSYSEFKKNFQYYADIAYWVQKEAERAILYIVKERSRLCNATNLAYTGGVALNAVANAKILNTGIFKNLYMTPAAGDNGLAIGCAYYGWLEVLKRQWVMHDKNSCFGKIYCNSSLGNSLADFKLPSDLNTGKVVNTFFEILKQGIAVKAPTTFTFTIQVVIKDCGMYMLEIRDGICRASSDVASRADATIMIESSLFIRLMLDFYTVSGTLREKEVILLGDVEQIAIFADDEATKLKMQEAIYKSGGAFKKALFTEEEDIIGTVATLLSRGKVIGWFQGSSEFGPRALGHRSIIADPRRKDIQHHINTNIKFREDFRPFAPSVLLEDVSKYFQYVGESPYMILVAQVQPEWKELIPGVVHKDNSCRIQTVTPDWNERYYQLLQKFKELTGIGVLLNTSFNKRNMPIVETPEQALHLFYECGLDYLVLDNFIVYKEQDDEYQKTILKTVRHSPA